ncbi:NYN domain-containing protein [Halovenus rubra]|uniref:NYN domain-containing protein n=2 Tax=Halovenus rubra TaxID=869890 RepID=A0ABD5XA75_9EURY|nr:NYN domain-containing protein [Halovenus rubra]
MGLFRRLGDSSSRVGLFVDGPNVFREEFDVDLDELRDLAGEEGKRTMTRLYLDEHATPSLIQAAEARGFAVVTTSGDVDVRLAVDATAAAVEDEIDILVVVSRDTDFKPVLETAATAGVETVAVAPGSYGRSDALKNSAQRALTL